MDFKEDFLRPGKSCANILPKEFWLSFHAMPVEEGHFLLPPERDLAHALRRCVTDISEAAYRDEEEFHVRRAFRCTVPWYKLVGLRQFFGDCDVPNRKAADRAQEYAQVVAVRLGERLGSVLEFVRTMEASDRGSAAARERSLDLSMLTI